MRLNGNHHHQHHHLGQSRRRLPPGPVWILTDPTQGCWGDEIWGLVCPPWDHADQPHVQGPMWIQAEAAGVARLLVWRLWGGQAGLGASYLTSWGILQLGPAGPVCVPDLACTKAMSLSTCHCTHCNYTKPDRGSVGCSRKDAVQSVHSSMPLAIHAIATLEA